jgi:hypothetical protein
LYQGDKRVRIEQEIIPAWREARDRLSDINGLPEPYQSEADRRFTIALNRLETWELMREQLLKPAPYLKAAIRDKNKALEDRGGETSSDGPD